MKHPRYLGLLARLLIHGSDREFVLGDLDELWARRVAEQGRLSADLRYVSEVLRSAVGRPRVPRCKESGGPLDTGRVTLASAFLDDLNAAFRSLRRNPRFALVVIITIALGIGPTAAVFGLVRQILLRPLPGVQYAETAAYLELRSDGEGPRPRLSPVEFDAIRTRATFLEGMASYAITLPVISLDDGRIRQIAAGSIYGDFFEVLGVAPSSGRLLRASETGFDADPFVVVISEQLRDDLFGAGEDAVGRRVVLDGHPFSIVGVSGGGFSEFGGDNALAWLPLAAMVPLQGRNRERMLAAETTAHPYYLVRPRPGVTARAAEAQVREILAQLREASNDGADEPLEVRAHLVEGLWPPPSERESAENLIRMMAWAVAFILAIACANVANLLLFRNATSTKAVVTRRALGATPERIGRQQLTETLLLAIGGGAVGVAVAKVVTLPFEGQGVAGIRALGPLSVDWSMVAFLLVVSLASALFFGTAPAILVGRAEPMVPGRSSGVDLGRQGLLRGVLSAGQLGLTLALLVGGLLMFRTIVNLRTVDIGVDVERVVRVTTGGSLSPGQFFRLPDVERHSLQRRLLAALDDLPDVEAVALDHNSPFSTPIFGEVVAGEKTDAESLNAWMRPVTPGWFDVFRLETLHGRTFVDADWQPSGSAGVVVTASLARRLYGRTNVVGATVRVGERGRNLEEHRILGVVDDLRSPRSPTQNIDQFFVAYDHLGDPAQWSAMVRVNRFDEGVAQRLEAAAATVLPSELYIHEPLPLQGVGELRVQEVMIGRLLWILCVFAVVLSGVGLFAAVAFVVSQRNRELGIRVALGADRSDVLALVLRSTIFVVTAGGVVGLIGAYALARVIESRLFGVVPLDVPSYMGATTIVLVVTSLACLMPARTALRTDPVATLRQE